MTHRPLRIAHVRRCLPAFLAGLAAAWIGPAWAARAAAPEVRPGAVTSIVVPVKGMTCALCTRGVEESIKHLDAVGEASAELATGLVRVQAEAGKSLNIREVRERVQRAGFKIGGECDVEATGRFSLGPDRRITFHVPGRAYSFQVLEGAEMKRLFRLSAGLKGEYFLVFRLHDHPRWKPPAISIVRGERLGVSAPAAAR